MEKKKLINDRISSIAPSVTLGVTSRANAMKADGKKVYSFAAGEPDFDTPDHIKSAAVKALAEGKTKYTPVVGLPQLRSAIVKKLAEENGLSYKPGEVVVSNGAKHSLFNVFAAICRDGDEVIIPSPYWLSYPEMVNIAGGKPVILHGAEKNGFKVTPKDLDRVITSKTKAIVINSPSNPSGIVYTREELKVLAEMVVERGIYIVSDEIYEKTIYDGVKHVSIGSLSSAIFDKTITVNGFSKAYSMTGWRLGYCAGPGEIINAVNALQSHSTSGATTFAQYGGLAALTGSQDCVARMVEAFTERRAYLYDRLMAIDGITCVKPMGAFYMLPNVSGFGLGSVVFAERLLESCGVAVVPGAPFGVDGHVRLSYACGMDTIKDGMDKFEGFVKSL